MYILLLSALKVVLVCFERQLGNQWYRLSLQVKEMALRKVGGLAFWDFIDFIVRTRIPIFVLLRPFIQCKVKKILESPYEITKYPLTNAIILILFKNPREIKKEASCSHVNINICFELHKT